MLADIRIDKARAHRSAYSAVIKRCLSQPGSKRAFARRLGVSQQHLSYLLADALGPEGGAVERRLPSPDLARRIASSLPLPPEEQAHLLAHMLAARAPAMSLAPPKVDAAAMFRALLPTMDGMRERALCSPHPDEVRSSVDKLMDMCRISLSQLGPIDHPIPYIQVSLHLAECTALRNQHATGLYHAHLAQSHLEHLEPSLEREERRAVGQLRIRSALMLGRLYADLRQSKRALEQLERAQQLAGGQANPAAWRPEIARQQARAHSTMRRFSLAAVEGIIDQGEAAIRADEPERGRQQFMLQLARAEMFLALGKLDHAEREFRRAHSIGRDPERVGLLHHLESTHGFARLCLARGDDPSYVGKLLQDHLERAERAGLTHRSRLFEQQLAELRGEIRMDSQARRESA